MQCKTIFDGCFQFLLGILSGILVTTARLLQAVPRKFWTSSLDCCYKIFGVRWSTCSTLFLRNFSTTGPAVFRYFSTPSTPSLLDTRFSAHPSAWTKMKWRVRSLRTELYRKFDALSTFVTLSRLGRQETGGTKDRNPESSLPAIKDRSSNVESHPIGHRGSRRHP